MPAAATTQARTRNDPRLASLAVDFFPHAPGARPWMPDVFFDWLRAEHGGLSDGAAECARLLADLADRQDIIEDIGRFDLVTALRLRAVRGAYTPGQTRALAAYLQEVWA